MSKRSISALLLGSAAMLLGCDAGVGEAASTGPSAKSFLDANKGPNVMVGEFRLPEGADVAATQIIACAEPASDCEGREIKAKPVRLSQGATAAYGYDEQDGGFVLKNLDPKARYQVVVWYDANRNDEADDGDTFGVMKGGAAVSAGYSERIKMATKGPLQNRSVEDGGARGALPTALVGTWSARGSGGSELKMTPTIKIQPNISAGGGFNMGGTMGAGSPTSTVIVNEYKSVKAGDRAQSLTINSDGSFKWIVDRGAPRGASCVEQVHEERLGKARVQGNMIILAISGGFSTLTNPCGEKFRDRRDPFPTRTEDYQFARSGNTLTLKGTGGVNWTFRKE